MKGNKALLVQPVFFRPLGFSEDRIGVGITHDAKLLAENGFEVHIINLDAHPGGAGNHGENKPKKRSWRKLAESSPRLESATESEELHAALEELKAIVREDHPDVVIMYSGDWPVPAKDSSDPSVDLTIGQVLRSMPVHTVCVGFTCLLRPEAYARAFDTVIRGVPGRTLLDAAMGKAGVLDGSGLSDYARVLPAIDRIVPSPNTTRVIGEFGCVYARCSFCPSAIQFAGRHVAKEPALFAADVAQRKEQTINIVDNYFGHDIDRLRQLAPLLGRLGKSYVVDLRLEAAENPEGLALLREMGTVTGKVGVESLSDKVLRRNRKGQSATQAVERLRSLHRAGFQVLAYLLLGAPGDTAETIQETLDRAEELEDTKFLPNFFCEPGDLDPRAHHFSLCQAERLGIPEALVERALRLSDRLEERACRPSPRPETVSHAAHAA